jgi:preprotein translocase subunit SecA
MQWAGMDENTPIEHSFATKAMTNSQVKTEAYHFDIRKHLVEYDDVVNKHREVIYAERKKILSGADLKANILSMVRDEIQRLVAKHLSNPHLASSLKGEEESEGEVGKSTLSGLLEDVSTIFPLPPQFRSDDLSELSAQQVTEKLTDYAIELYSQREQEMGADRMRLLERFLMLIGAEATIKLWNGKYDGKPTGGIDSLWIRHLTAMEDLRQGIGLRAVGQEQPLVVYKREGHAYFEALLASIQHDVVHSIYRVGLAKEAPQRKKEAVPVGRRAGRNDPCPCGSGKKYKHCCGK